MIHIVWILFLFSCQQKEESNTSMAKCNGEEIEIQLESRSDSSFLLKPKVGSENDPKKNWDIPYPVYHWEIADIDEDGCDEILVGVIKSTRYDPKPAKRLFIFKLFEGYIRPKWMGSRLSQPLVNFKVIDLDGTKVLSIEREKNGNFLLALYSYSSFGLKFENYLVREKEIEEVKLLFTFL
ncbi:MAG: hypothetical protein R2799_05950 [Crocinitomicaceae bacterium]